MHGDIGIVHDCNLESVESSDDVEKLGIVTGSLEFCEECEQTRIVVL